MTSASANRIDDNRSLLAALQPETHEMYEAGTKLRDTAEAARVAHNAHLSAEVVHQIAKEKLAGKLGELGIKGRSISIEEGTATARLFFPRGQMIRSNSMDDLTGVTGKVID